jgi:tRNA(Ile)-lysidine synthase
VQAADTHSALNGLFDGLTGVPRVAVAVSGGSDSIALLNLVAEWSRTLRGPKDVFALTVDHGLRSGSDIEAQRVGQWCAALKVPHVTLPWQGEKPSTGIQARARKMRYDLLAQWCRTHAVPILMTGHTADDQAETVYMRQKRTSSLKSLAGIWAENEWMGVRLLRPLLSTRRDALRAYLRGLGKDWLDDPSNDNPRFERVRVRQALEDEPIEGLQAIAQSAQDAVVEQQQLAKLWLSHNANTDVYGVVRLIRKALHAERTLLRHMLMSKVIEAAGSGTRPEAAGVEQVSAWLQQGASGRRSLSGAIVNARHAVIEVMREPGRIRDRWDRVADNGRAVFDGRFDVSAPAGSLVGPMGQPALLKRFKDVPALAFSALPAVKLPDGEVVSAVKSTRNDISATLCERFSL